MMDFCHYETDIIRYSFAHFDEILDPSEPDPVRKKARINGMSYRALFHARFARQHDVIAAQT